MNSFFEFLFMFLVLFAIVYTLAYLPEVLKLKTWVKQNLIFIFSFGLMFLLEKTLGPGIIKFSNFLSICFMFLIFNIYLSVNEKIKKWGRILNVLIDLILCSLTLFASSCIVAYIDNLPIRIVIHERFDDGGYSFSPGNFYEMRQVSIVFTVMIINFKYIHFYLLKKWEERQKKKISDLQSQKKNIEIQFGALQAKVNPHFLYNSLNSIAGLATVDGDKTRQMALALSRFFRYSMNKEQEFMITVEQEAEMTETYLAIEKIRFDDKLNYHMNVPDSAKSYKIPKMLLQPIVENCITHGMKGHTEALDVNISFSLSGTTLSISIKDSGTPFPDDFIPGYGIKSVYEKLELLFPEKYNVELTTTPEKDFRIVIF
jgi:Putative regulator of cell autolysis